MGKKNLKILIATDFSPESKSAFKMTDRLSLLFNLNISLIHVISSRWKLWFYADGYKDEIASRLKTWREQHLSEQQVEKILLKVGNPAENILHAAEQQKSKLILIGQRKSNKGGRYRSGTALKTIIKSARQSILVCQGDEPIKEIIVGIDGSSASKKVLRWSIDLARSLAANLNMVSVLQVGGFNPLGLSERQVKDAEQKYKSESEQKLQEIYEQFDFADIELKKTVRWGNPAETLLDLAEDSNADLMIIGAKGHSRLHYVLLGSTAAKVSDFAPCSLLVVR